MDYYLSLDNLLDAYQKFCKTTRFEIIKDSKYIVTRNKKILKVGFHAIKDKDVLICYDKTSGNHKKNYKKTGVTARIILFKWILE